MKKVAFIIIIFLVGINITNGQTSEYINGREFIFHTVKRGETVYGISKKYDIPQDSIFAYNKNAKKGIKTDEILKIPTNNYEETSIPTNNGEFLEHIVQYGETLYSIAKKYNITIAEIEKYNPKVKNGLKAEDTLLISVKGNQNNDNNDHADKDTSRVVNNEPVSVKCDTVKTTKSTFKIALILPFKGNSFSSNKIASEFYYGFKVAVDSVAAVTGKKVKLFVMNSSATNDSDLVEEQYDFNKLKQMDMIIGPLYASNIKPIAEFAKENKIPIISPFTSGGSFTNKNPYAIKITPSDKLMAHTTLTYFTDSFPNCNFILVNTKSRRDSLQHLGYKEALLELNIKDTNRVHFVNYGSESVSNYIRSGVKNVVIFMASREITVKDFITKFNKAHKKTDISLVGTEGWLEFNNVEADYYSNLNLHIPVPTYTDFSDSTKYYGFIRKYQSIVKADPSIYSFKGYKIGADVIGRFLQYGNYLCNCLDEPIKLKADQMDIPFRFNFIRNDEESGWENATIQMLSVYEYQLFIQNLTSSYTSENK